MSELQFEWDEAKNTANKRKHGVSFEEAQTVFSDELARLIPDPDHSEGEERYIFRYEYEFSPSRCLSLRTQFQPDPHYFSS